MSKNNKIQILSESQGDTGNVKSDQKVEIAEQFKCSGIKGMSQNEYKKKNQQSRVNEQVEKDMFEAFIERKQCKKIYRITQTCQICFTDISDQNIKSSLCGHSFHTECLQFYIDNQINNRISYIKCPQDKCETQIQQNLIRKLAKDFSKYLQFQLEELLIDPILKKEFSCCPRPGCEYIFKLKPNQAKFVCQKCGKSYCLKCRCDYHNQWSCTEYQKLKDPNFREEAFNKFVSEQNGKQCQRCGVWVIKSQGCNHMTCTCGYEFCYKCGRIYKDPNCRCPLFDRT